ncbi:MAG TPA: DUF6468 domain-containing protein [Caulobacteraceae bacterium]|jgi:soluble cytochrome b562
MSPISLALNLLLAGLLTLTLVFGWRLSRQLKALKDSHVGFADAVGDLDRAAQRAEAGLVELRVSTDQAVDLLIGRIDKARELADRLEGLTARAEIAAEKAPPPRAAPPVRSIFDRPRAAAPPPPVMRQTTEDEAEAAAEALILRLSEREVLTSDTPEPRIAARARTRAGEREWALDRELDRAESRTGRRFDSLFEPRAQGRSPVAREARAEPREDLHFEEPRREELRAPPRPEPRATPRSRAQIDDDLFDPPARGGRLRAFDGGLS